MLVRLLAVAQPDGQYSAAATLFNLASYSANVRDLIIAADAIPALMPMLNAESWYVAAVKHTPARLLWSRCKRDLFPAFPCIPLPAKVSVKHF